jgi:ketosteroid isomerase-like protein
MDAREMQNRVTIERLSEGFARHDVEAILACFTDDGIFDITEGPDPWGERFQGKTAVRVALETLFKALPDVQFVDATAWVAGDRGVSEWTCIATTPKGRDLRVRGCDLFEFREGLITRKDSYFKKLVRKDATSSPRPDDPAASPDVLRHPMANKDAPRQAAG